MGANGASGDYNLENSLRFRSSASAYLSRTPATASNRKTWTWSGWYKGSLFGGTDPALFSSRVDGNNNTYLLSYSATASQLSFRNEVSGAGTTLTTAAVFRDPSAWYHILYSIDTTQATESNRVKIYVNGVQQSVTGSYPPLNTDTMINATNAHNVGSVNSSVAFLDGYLTEVNFVDGQALTASDFGDTNEDTGVWQPARYTGTYGTNGFYLDMSTSGSTVTDQSGNGNNWTANNMNLTTSTAIGATTYDIMSDVPTLTDEDTANYAVMNPLDLSIYTANSTLDGNLSFKNTTTNANGCGRATIGVSSGKWYWETTVTALGGVYPDLGILGSTQPFSDNTQTYIAGYSTGYAYRGSGDKGNNASIVAYGAAYTTGDVIGTALDLDAGTITFYKDNVSQGVAYTGLSGQFSPAWANYSSGVFTANFGQRPFAYTPPAGYLKLNTFNLPDSSIEDGSEYFDTVTYAGNSGTNTITELDFQPDFTWIKSTSNSASHSLIDSVRGYYNLRSNSTIAEFSNSGFWDGFNSNGFNLIGPEADANTTGYSYVAWNWKAGGTAVSNTDGTITSSVSANPTAGFSVVTYTGTGSAATVGHGLSSAPKMILLKSRNAVSSWSVYANSVGAGSFLQLNTTYASAVNSLFWNNTTPTSSVFSIGTNNSGGTQNYVAYCFAEVEGYSKFGSYTGNGSADGPFVYTVFRPAWVLIKASSFSGSYWSIADNKREPNNVSDSLLFPNTTDAESTDALYSVDYLSNGFKIKNSNNSHNTNGATYIYMAFAENPFKNSLAR